MNNEQFYNINEVVYFVNFDLAYKIGSFCPIKGVIIGIEQDVFLPVKYYIIKPIEEYVFDFCYLERNEIIKLHIEAEKRNSGGFVSRSFEKTQEMAVRHLSEMTVSVFRKIIY